MILKTFAACLVFAIVGIAGTISAQADALRFSNVVALQNGGATSVSLFSNPGVTLTGPQLTFLIDITGTLAPGESHMLLVTFTEAGGSATSQQFLIPAFGFVPPPFSQIVTFTSLYADFDGVLATLTVDILGVAPDFEIPGGPNAGQLVDSYTYTFNVAQPVPEPGTLVMVVMGMAGLASRTRLKLKKKSCDS